MSTSEEVQPSVASSPSVIFRPYATILRILICLLAALSWGLSFELTKLSGGANSSLVWLQQSCGGETDSDCASVLKSYYGRFSLGANLSIPVGVLGMAYSAVIFLWYFFVGVPTYAYRWRHLPIVLLVVIGALRSAGYLYIMGQVLERWCIGCVTVHVLNGLIVLFTLAAFPWRSERKAMVDRPGAGLWFATAGFCLSVGVLHILSGVLLVQASSSSAIQKRYKALIEDPSYVRWHYESQPKHALPPREGALVAGSPEAEFEIVVFSDLQCPACRNAHRMIESLLDKHPNQLRVVYRHLPLNAACNPATKTVGHPHACEAAVALESVAQRFDREQALRFQRLVFGRQEMIKPASLIQWAEEIGLKVEKTPAVEQAIREDVALMQELSLTAPPVILLNGRQVKYWTSQAGWESLLDLPQSDSPFADTD